MLHTPNKSFSCLLVSRILSTDSLIIDRRVSFISPLSREFMNSQLLSMHRQHLLITSLLVIISIAHIFGSAFSVFKFVVVSSSRTNGCYPKRLEEQKRNQHNECADSEREDDCYDCVFHYFTLMLTDKSFPSFQPSDLRAAFAT